MSETNELIRVVQLPEITEQLHQLKQTFEQYALDAESMICSVDTVQAVKSFRADMRKVFDAVEEQRKTVKKAIMEPYERLEAVYKECVTEPFRRAYASCSRKVTEAENDLRACCEESLRDYFYELCAVHHLDWLTYERAGIKVDMASAKAKTPKRLREQLAAFVAGVAESVDRINTLEDAGEIMVEYQRTLDAADAICAVKERHQRIDEQKKFQEQREAIRAQEAEAVRRVESLSPPVSVPMQNEGTIKVSLVMHPTKTQFEEKIKPIMRQLKQICDMEGIKYE